MLVELCNQQLMREMDSYLFKVNWNVMNRLEFELCSSTSLSKPLSIPILQVNSTVHHYLSKERMAVEKY